MRRKIEAGVSAVSISVMKERQKLVEDHPLTLQLLVKESAGHNVGRPWNEKIGSIQERVDRIRIKPDLYPSI